LRLAQLHMSRVLSKDGASIAFERSGRGAPLILVDGALCYRASGPSGPLAALLTQHFTVFTYDRRGRGESSDTAPYAVEREIEDIEALIQQAGGSSFVYGISSGAALALEAARRLPGIKKLTLYEAPFIDASHSPMPEDYLARLKALIAADRRSKPLPAERWASVTINTLVTNGGKSPTWMRNAMRALADVLPNAKHRTLEGQTDMLKAQAIAPLLVKCF